MRSLCLSEDTDAETSDCKKRILIKSQGSLKVEQRFRKPWVESSNLSSGSKISQKGGIYGLYTRIRRYQF